jgi:WD40 repeat protein/tRNA A-37 threonylcarbamoyl transferase component Bud32
MKEGSSRGNDVPCVQLARRLDQVCDRFEAAWKAGRRPRLERYLRQSPPAAQAELLRELLVLELEYRYENGEEPRWEEYHLRLPEHAEVINTAFREARPTTPSIPYLLPKWVMSRLANQVSMLAFPPDERKLDQQEPLAVPLHLLDPATAEDGQASEATRPASSELDPATVPFEAGTAVPPVQSEADKETSPLAILGDYELLKLLGKGGMGMVYRARQCSTNRIVALKVIRSDRLEQLSDAERQEWFERFRREGQIAARLHHDNLVTVYDRGQVDGQHFYSMRFVEGQSLGEVLRQGPLPNERAALYLEQVARALHALHLHGIVHRDLKPTNILVDTNQRPFVTDFGLAKWSEYTQGLTRSVTCMGTPEYTAPEQARNPAGARPASDIYSLGATLYELLTGRPPFRAADPVETLRQVEDEEPLSPRRLNPAVHRDLELICLKCLEKEPHKRYASALQMADELQRYRTGEPLRHTRPVGRAEHLWRWCRRKPSQAAAAGLAAVVLMAATALTIGGGFIVQLREEQKKTVRLSTLLALGDGLKACEQGKVAQGMLMWANHLDTAAEHKDLQRPIRANLAAWYRQLWPLKAIIPDPDVDYATLSADGKIVLTVKRAATGKQGEVRFWDAATVKPVGNPIPHDLQDPNLLSRLVVLSPDGRTILTGSNNLVRRWDATTGVSLGEPYPVMGEIKALAFGPDGTTILTASEANEAALPSFTASTVGLLSSVLGQGPFLAASAHISGTMSLVEIRTWSVATGNYRSVFLLDQYWPFVLFSPDSKKVLIKNGTIARLWDTTTGKELHRLESHEGEISAVAFGPDGKLLLVGSKGFTARLWDTATGKETHALKGHQGKIEVVAFSRDGQTIGTGSADGTVRLWDTATEEQLGAPLAHGGKVTALAVNSDRRTVLTLSSDKHARLWSGPPAGLLVAVLPHPSPVERVAFSRDGRNALICATRWPICTSKECTGQQSGEALVWNLTTMKPLAPPVQHGGCILAAAFSPDNRTVLTGSTDKKARLWDINNPGHVHELPHEDYVFAVAFSADGETALTGSNDGKARLWNASTGELLGELLHPEAVFAVAFSHDCRKVLTGSNDSIARLWDVTTRMPLMEFVGHRSAISAVAFSPDDQKVMTGSCDGTARLWHTATGRLLDLPVLQHEARVHRVAFNDPDGNLLLTGSLDRTVRLWDAGTGLPLGTVSHAGEVNDAAFSSDGTLVLTGSADHSARLLDTATTVQIGPIFSHPATVWAVAFSPDHEWALTGCADNNARLWKIPSPVEGDAERIRLWTQLITGMKLNPNSAFRHLNAKEWDQCRHELEGRGGPPVP